MLANEIVKTPLPDQRLKQRLGKIVERLSQFPNMSIPQALERWGDVKAAYRFFRQ